MPSMAGPGVDSRNDNAAWCLEAGSAGGLAHEADFDLNVVGDAISEAVQLSRKNSSGIARLPMLV